MPKVKDETFQAQLNPTPGPSASTMSPGAFVSGNTTGEQIARLGEVGVRVAAKAGEIFDRRARDFNERKKEMLQNAEAGVIYDQIGDIIGNGPPKDASLGDLDEWNRQNTMAVMKNISKAAHLTPGQRRTIMDAAVGLFTKATEPVVASYMKGRGLTTINRDGTSNFYDAPTPEYAAHQAEKMQDVLSREQPAKFIDLMVKQNEDGTPFITDGALPIYREFSKIANEQIRLNNEAKQLTVDRTKQLISKDEMELQKKKIFSSQMSNFFGEMQTLRQGLLADVKAGKRTMVEAAQFFRNASNQLFENVGSQFAEYGLDTGDLRSNFKTLQDSVFNTFSEHTKLQKMEAEYDMELAAYKSIHGLPREQYEALARNQTFGKATFEQLMLAKVFSKGEGPTAELMNNISLLNSSAQLADAKTRGALSNQSMIDFNKEAAKIINGNVDIRSDNPLVAVRYWQKFNADPDKANEIISKLGLVKDGKPVSWEEVSEIFKQKIIDGLGEEAGNALLNRQFVKSKSKEE